MTHRAGTCLSRVIAYTHGPAVVDVRLEALVGVDSVDACAVRVISARAAYRRGRDAPGDPSATAGEVPPDRRADAGAPVVSEQRVLAFRLPEVHPDSVRQRRPKPGAPGRLVVFPTWDPAMDALLTWAAREDLELFLRWRRPQ